LVDSETEEYAEWREKELEKNHTKHPKVKIYD
jgi:hypothetical protein